MRYGLTIPSPRPNCDLAIEAFPGGEELGAEQGGHGGNVRSGVAIDLHANRGGHLDHLWHELLYRRTVEVRTNGGDVRVALHQAAALAVGAQVKVVTERARFFLADRSHLFHNRLEFRELSLVDFEINQQPYTVRCHAHLLHLGRLARTPRYCAPTPSRQDCVGALPCLTYFFHSEWGVSLLLVIHELGFVLLAVRRGAFSFQGPALTVFRKFDLAGAHGLAALHVVDLQRAIALGCAWAGVHARRASDRIGLAIELAGPFRVCRLPGSVHAVGGDREHVACSRGIHHGSVLGYTGGNLRLRFV